MTSPNTARRTPAIRAAAMALALALLLPACQTTGATGMANTAALTPQQQALREQSERWNRTAATGALAGAALGAGTGALIGGRNRGTNALIGAGIGLVGGLLAGAVVADRNLAFENRELTAGQRIEAAQQISANLNNAADASERVTQENRQTLARLDRQYRAGQITSAQYRGETEAMRQDVDLMRKTAGEAQDARQRLVASGSEVPQLMREESKIDSAQRRLEVSASDLEAALRRVPPV